MTPPYLSSFAIFSPRNTLSPAPPCLAPAYQSDRCHLLLGALEWPFSLLSPSLLAWHVPGLPDVWGTAGWGRGGKGVRLRGSGDLLSSDLNIKRQGGSRVASGEDWQRPWTNRGPRPPSQDRSRPRPGGTSSRARRLVTTPGLSVSSPPRLSPHRDPHSLSGLRKALTPLGTAGRGVSGRGTGCHSPALGALKTMIPRHG